MNTRILFIMLAFGSILFTSCRETVTEREVVREVEVEREEVEVEEDEEGIIERTGKEIDNEVNEEIDEEIEKIGDDN
ncbi:MAG: hypothetical protein R3209_01235 [Salinimicrobium sediminis]|uniref:Uncharacterized protein n=1 Tax=Salinimicrobium sediminis TaxID=1343891 RepID=A0A285X398_9FLAO|nr:hypothetical protein [Salinimicrobium sediminis]MDX1601664.1 hypothetical protein [Salinimicrobium sediminis]MDX1751579.1 hypothetical protein [Salinimicrobium sediminis]SOC79782.1 hypothetical protein SAMN06296241_1318 [Salinimicrobium sediminis]